MDYVREDKIKLIYFALSRGIRTFADLGGSWGVEGYYTRFTLEKGDIEKAYIIDLFCPPGVQELEREYEQFVFIKGDFTQADVLNRIPKVDAIYLFDVLLHQADPDWDEVLRRISPKTDRLVIFNPQWKGLHSVRLADLGEDEFYRVTPHYKGDPLCVGIFETPEKMTNTGRLGKDNIAPFQWGITNLDLDELMWKLGFGSVYYKNNGDWMTYPHFEANAFVYERCHS
jgi:hypothetical protein